jgi:UDP-N-acetylmuramyl pentapeptide phosphotransferase/UDP-N-acetylglucosamine-1-phosphate transferase
MYLELSIYSIGIIFFISLIFFINIKRISSYFKLYDYTNERKIHNSKISLIGGVILYASFLVSFYFFSTINHLINLSLLIFTTFFFIVGLLDDLKNLNAKFRILFITIFLFFFYFDNVFLIEKIMLFNSPYYFGELSRPITIICVLLLYISLNMLDGIDGITLLYFIFSILFLILFYETSSADKLIFGSLIFSSFILLIMNLKKKIFIGNSGTSVVVSILAYFLINYNFTQTNNVFYTISILILPGIDMIRLFFMRIKNRINPLDPDLNHFHHILFYNYGLAKALSIYLFLCFFPSLIFYFLNLNILIMTTMSIFIYIMLIIFSKNAKY